MKEQYIAYYKQRVNKNAMLRQTVPIIDETYKQDFLKVIILNGRTLPFRRFSCT